MPYSILNRTGKGATVNPGIGKSYFSAVFRRFGPGSIGNFRRFGRIRFGYSFYTQPLQRASKLTLIMQHHFVRENR